MPLFVTDIAPFTQVWMKRLELNGSYQRRCLAFSMGRSKLRL